jgi:hypothetical protein
MAWQLKELTGLLAGQVLRVNQGFTFAHISSPLTSPGQFNNDPPKAITLRHSNRFDNMSKEQCIVNRTSELISQPMLEI